MAGVVLAIDLGTSTIKVALVATDGRIIVSGQSDCGVDLVGRHGAEQDPETWWRHITGTSSRLVSSGVVKQSDIVAVCCTGQWSGTIATDADGNPVRPAITWMDSRGAPYVRQVTRGLVRFRGYGLLKARSWIRKSSGIPTHSGKDPAGHILWLMNSEPDAYLRTRYLLEPRDWLNFRLTGRAAATYESITLHWVTDNRDLDRIRYDSKLIRMSGVDRWRLPELVAATDVLGYLLPDRAAELGVPPGLPVVAGAPDLLVSAIGTGTLQDFVPHMHCGAANWIGFLVPFKKASLRSNITALPAPVPGRRAVIGAQLAAGRILKYLSDLAMPSGTPPADAYRELDRMAGLSPPGSNGVMCVPWLYGERSPVEDPYARAAFYNLSLQTGAPDLIRAAYEGVALNARWLLEAMDRFSHRRLTPVRLTGGGALSGLWCQIYADVLGRPVEQVADPGLANARGAALLAAVALGHLRFAEVPALVQVDRTYQPTPGSQDLYESLFAEFIQFYRHNRKIFARLNAPGRAAKLAWWA